RNDVLIVASVSCIYGLGTAEAYYELKVALQTGEEYPRHKLLRDLVEIQYERDDHDFSRGTFRVKGDTIEIFPAYEEERAIRVAQGGAGRVRLPAALRARQPAAAVRRVRAAGEPGRLRLRHARRVRAAEERRRDRGADHPPHRPGGSASGSAPRRAAGGRSPG